MSLKQHQKPTSLLMLGMSDSAAVLGISVTTLRDMMRRGLFPAPVRVNRRDMFSVETLRKFSSGEWRAPTPAIPERAA